MRLIDADALNKKLCETTIFIKGGEIFQRMINDAPTIEPDGDLISRQDAIDVLAKFVPYAICDESTESYTNGLKDAYNLICQLPSAEPKTGEWVKVDNWGGFRCDKCGWEMVGTSRFCPNCGADMRGES